MMKRDDHQGGEATTLSSRRTTTNIIDIIITNRLETLVAAWDRIGILLFDGKEIAPALQMDLVRLATGSS